ERIHFECGGQQLHQRPLAARFGAAQLAAGASSRPGGLQRTDPNLRGGAAMATELLLFGNDEGQRSGSGSHWLQCRHGGLRE
ncbi:unnamed protein product, partial [Symbiodinium sp. KB8]